METIAIFDKYAKTADNTQTLTKAELKTHLEKELPNFLPKTAWLNFCIMARAAGFIHYRGSCIQKHAVVCRNFSKYVT